jgi:predicted kinase
LRSKLRLGHSVMLESGFWLRADRDEKRLSARALGAAVELRYLAAPTDELVHRSDIGDAQVESVTVPISRSDIEAWLAALQAPDDAEMALFDLPINSTPPR